MPGTVSEGQKGLGGWVGGRGEAGYHLYLPPAPLPPLTRWRKHEKYWRRHVSLRQEKCAILTFLIVPVLLRRNEKKMLNPNVGPSPFHLPHPFSSAVLLSAFNGMSPPIRIHVFLLQNRTIFCPGSQSSKHNKQLWHSKLLLSLPTGKIQVALHTHNPGSQRKQAWMLSAGPANLIIASGVFKHDCKV